MKITKMVDTQPLSRTEQDNLWVKYKEGDMGARDKLINSHLRLVESMVNKLVNGSPVIKNKEDLIQDGCIGLIEAIDKYDPSRGTKFITYAHYHIRKRLWEGYVDIDRTIKLPQGVIIDMTKVIKAESEFMMEYDREPTCEELEELTDLNSSRIGLIKQNIRNTKTLSPVVGEDGMVDYEIMDVKDITKECIAETSKSQLSLLLDSLPDRERLMITMRFGLDGETPKSYKSISEEFNLTPERTRVIITNILNKMKTKLEILGFELSDFEG